MKLAPPPVADGSKEMDPLLQLFITGHVSAELTRLQTEYPFLRQDQELQAIADALFEEYQGKELRFGNIERIYGQLLQRLETIRDSQSNILNLRSGKRFVLPPTLPKEFTAFIKIAEGRYDRDYFLEAEHAARGMIILGELTDPDQIIPLRRDSVRAQVMEMFDDASYATTDEASPSVHEKLDYIADDVPGGPEYIDEARFAELLRLMAKSDEALRELADEDPEVIATILLLRDDIRKGLEECPDDPADRKEWAGRIFGRPRPKLTLVGGGNERKGPQKAPSSSDSGTSSGSTGGDAAQTKVQDAA